MLCIWMNHSDVIWRHPKGSLARKFVRLANYDFPRIYKDTISGFFILLGTVTISVNFRRGHAHVGIQTWSHTIRHIKKIYTSWTKPGSELSCRLGLLYDQLPSLTDGKKHSLVEQWSLGKRPGLGDFLGGLDVGWFVLKLFPKTKSKNHQPNWMDVKDW